MLKNMSLETRNSSALCKRAEQLKRWEESDTNRESMEPKNPSKRKIQFSSGCIFLAACIAGDKEEVERLLDDSADIDTSNVDGLTALHQACIDNNLEMVEFLIQRGSDINRKDNEGWTPLHATASCGFLSIARYLIENGADLAAVNSDGDLPIDIAYNADMEDLIDKYVCEQGIDCVEARQTEEKLMLNDAKKWLRSDAAEADRPHPKTGATALHVAAAKGYTKVLSLLLAGRADVDKQDIDGWTPLHAAAYWGQKEAAQMLMASMGDLDIKNYAGQTPIDIATKELVPVLEELKKNSKRTKRRPASQIRVSDNLENNVETPSKVIRVEVKNETKNTENCDDKPKAKTETTSITKEANELESDAPWRRITTLRNRSQQDSPPKIIVPEKENKLSEPEVILRRTQSFENDEKKTSTTSSPPTSPTTTTAANITNSTISSGAGQIRRSFVPPTRDEESETQRKAHAKRVRETRRSTQGVTLDEIKSAEKLVQKKNANNTDNENETTMVTAPFNDRVPSSSDNNIDKEEEIISETITLRHPVEQQVISTTFTINAPSPITLRETEERKKVQAELTTAINDDNEVETGGEDEDIETAPEEIEEEMDEDNYVKTTDEEGTDDEEEVISACFTMPPPVITENVVLFNATLPTAINDQNKTDDDVWETKRNSKTYIMATINVPTLVTASNNNTKKTESEDYMKPLSPTTISPVRSSNNNYNDENRSSLMMSQQLRSDKTETKDDNSKPASPNEDLLGGGDVRLRDIREKRSLFDLDNASSLTLAEKLRNEANKYSETLTSLQSVDQILAASDMQKPDEVTSSPVHMSSAERRPSWRLKFDAGCKFKLEDAPTTSPTSSSTTSVSTVGAAVPSSPNKLSNNTTLTGSSYSTVPTVTQRREHLINAAAITSTARPLSAPAISTAVQETTTNSTKESSTEVTLPLRRVKSNEDKENDKENDSRSAQATQAVIQRRRRPKRRSTGVVHVDTDDNDPDRQESPVDGDDKESGTEQPSSRSRVSSTHSLSNDVDSSENCELIDYKALYEAAKADNDKLKITLRKKDEDLVSVKGALDRFTNATTKNSLSELEKREKRAMERKISEMEEELKQLDALKTENQRLKDENGALIRVISKLSK